MVDFVILTEAGGTVGYGHMMRCLAIANHAHAELYVHPDGDYPDSKNCKKFPWRTNLDKLINDLPSSCSLLVDSYLADRHIYEILSNHFDYVTVLDDYNRLDYPVNLIINPGIKLPDYRNQTAKVIGGNNYIILRKEIIQHVKKTDYLEYRNLLVTLGGCDTTSILAWLVPSLTEYSNMVVTIIVGNNDVYDTLSNQYNNLSMKWFGQIDAQDMAKLIYQADVCISAGGQTLHELAYIGVPTIGIQIGGDQKNNIEGYVEAGFLQEKLSLDTIDLPQKIDHLLNVYNSIELRKRIAENGQAIVDGQGVRRIAELLKQAS